MRRVPIDQYRTRKTRDERTEARKPVHLRDIDGACEGYVMRTGGRWGIFGRYNCFIVMCET